MTWTGSGGFAPPASLKPHQPGLRQRLAIRRFRVVRPPASLKRESLAACHPGAQVAVPGGSPPGLIEATRPRPPPLAPRPSRRPPVPSRSAASDVRYVTAPAAAPGRPRAAALALDREPRPAAQGGPLDPPRRPALWRSTGEPRPCGEPPVGPVLTCMLWPTVDRGAGRGRSGSQAPGRPAAPGGQVQRREERPAPGRNQRRELRPAWGSVQRAGGRVALAERAPRLPPSSPSRGH